MAVNVELSVRSTLKLIPFARWNPGNRVHMGPYRAEDAKGRTVRHISSRIQPIGSLRQDAIHGTVTGP